MSVILMSVPVKPSDVRSLEQAHSTGEFIEWCNKKGRMFRARVVARPRWEFDPGAPGYVIDLELIDAETLADVMAEAGMDKRIG